MIFICVGTPSDERGHTDLKYIFKAASQASKAVDYLLSFSRTRAELTEAIDELIMA